MNTYQRSINKITNLTLENDYLKNLKKEVKKQIKNNKLDKEVNLTDKSLMRLESFYVNRRKMRDTYKDVNEFSKIKKKLRKSNDKLSQEIKDLYQTGIN